MKGDSLPPGDHVTRHCKFKWLDEEGNVQGDAFLLEPGHDYVSVFWLEFTGRPAREQQIEDVRRRMQRGGRRLGGKSKLAVLSVGNTIEQIADLFERELLFRHEPGDAEEDLDEAHAGIYGIGAEDELIAETIARQLVVEVFPAIGDEI